MVLKNHHASTKEIKSVRLTFVDILNLRHRFIPTELNFHQKQIFLNTLVRANSDSTIMESNKTGNRGLVYEFNMETSQQTFEWKEKQDDTKITLKLLKKSG